MSRSPEVSDTRSLGYSEYLKKRSIASSLFQLPYRLHLKYLRLGKTLEVGCGSGRHLATLSAGSVGIDHNRFSIDVCRSRGLEAYLPDEFESRADGFGTFDTLLLSHVVEHMSPRAADQLISRYATNVSPDGRIVIITPQEVGFASDSSHVAFSDFRANRSRASAGRFEIDKEYSFPLPRFAGRLFRHNEFVSIGKRCRAGR